MHLAQVLSVAMLIVSSSAFRRPSPVGVFQKFLLTTQVAASSSSSSQLQNKIHLYHNDMYKVQLPDSHKFPMDKYTHVREMISGNPAFEGKIVFKESPLALVPELETTHHPDYIERFLSGNMSEKEIRVSGFPWTQKGVNRALSSVGGTVAAMRAVMSSSHDQSSNGSGCAVAAHLAGGTHHAMPDRAEGFCIFSDIAVAANLALQEYPELQRVLIIDLDVHQGNGNAVIFQDDERVFTFSMHCEGNIFSKKAKSDLDVDLPNGMTDDEYLAKLKGWLTPFLMDVVKPGLVFYQAGVDVSEHDRLGKLKITREGLRRRNELLYNAVKRRGIPLVLTMGGGYPKDLDPHSEAFINLIGAHSDCYSQLIETFSPP